MITTPMTCTAQADDMTLPYLPEELCTLCFRDLPNPDLLALAHSCKLWAVTALRLLYVDIAID
jgi:hypothetical protein